MGWNVVGREGGGETFCEIVSTVSLAGSGRSGTAWPRCRARLVCCSWLCAGFTTNLKSWTGSCGRWREGGEGGGGEEGRERSERKGEGREGGRERGGMEGEG
jgi:hypothetical protein